MTVTSSDIRDIYTFPTSKNTVNEIAVAALFVSETLAGKGLSQTRLDLIEKYIAAHFVQISQGGALTSKGVGGSKETYAGKFGQSLLATSFGQTAITLDISGTLAELANPTAKARFRVIGRNPTRASCSTGDDDNNLF